MNHTAIQVEGLSKEYRIGQRAPYHRFSETLSRAAAAACRAALRPCFPRSSSRAAVAAGSSDTPGGRNFWALKDVSFNLARGEVLGVVGRNGAGKSTLLKLLSRITEPTVGRAILYGRVGSLLEVGTGFHPELTGRENIFLNGAILGMKRSEIKRCFDDIVAFAEVESFVDMPVKHYSSGMYMRLAFAVAAHLETEILIVDEVLAVGDAQFQKRCLQKMGDLAGSGRTVLFVSHNMAAVERLCSSSLLLEQGRLAMYGPTAEVLQRYTATDGGSTTKWLRPTPYPDAPHFRQAYLCDSSGAPCNNPTSAAHLGFIIEVCLPSPTRDVVLAAAIANSFGHWLFSTTPSDVGVEVPHAAGIYRTKLMLPPALLMPQPYALTLALYKSGITYERFDQTVSFLVQEVASLANQGVGKRVGDLQILCKWDPFWPHWGNYASDTTVASGSTPPLAGC